MQQGEKEMRFLKILYIYEVPMLIFSPFYNCWELVFMVRHLPAIQRKTSTKIVWYLITNTYFWLREFSFWILEPQEALNLNILQFKYLKLKKGLKPS